MWWMGLMAVTVVLGLGRADGFTRQLAPAASLVAYDDFMKLSVDERRGRFSEISAENKAMIMRTHAERWLDRNERRLTASEVAVFQEAIAFITPELYGPRPNATLDKREAALRAKIRCRVSPDDVMRAFSLFGGSAESRPPKPTWTYLSQAKCWLEWIAEGLVDYVPSPRH